MPTSSKVGLIKQLIDSARNNLETASQLLQDVVGPEGLTEAVPSHITTRGSVQQTDQGSVVIEGVFDGQNMVGPDGKLYSVPANYASKSKLVEGDLLKLTISPDGSFIYKQIGPIERDRFVGVLIKDAERDDFKVLANGKYYRILLASVTYFKASVGDEIVILVPKGAHSDWAAVENVIKKTEGGVTPLAGMPTPTVATDLINNAANPVNEELGSTAPQPPMKRGPGRPRKVDQNAQQPNTTSSPSTENLTPTPLIEI